MIMRESNVAYEKWPYLGHDHVRIPAIVVPVAVSVVFIVWKLFYASDPLQNRHLNPMIEKPRRHKDDEEEASHSRTTASSHPVRNVWLDRIDKLCLFGFHGQMTLRYMWTPNALTEEIWWLAPAEILMVLLAGVYHENDIRGSFESWSLALAWMLPLAQQLEILGQVPFWMFILLALPFAWPKPLTRTNDGAWGHFFFSTGCLLTYAFNGIISDDSPWREYRLADMELWPNFILAGLAILQPAWRWTCDLAAPSADRDTASRMEYMSANATALIRELARCLRAIAFGVVAWLVTGFAGGSCIGWRYLLLDLPASHPSFTKGDLAMCVAGSLMIWTSGGIYVLRRRQLVGKDIERLFVDASGYALMGLLFLALMLWASRRLADSETSLMCFDQE